MKIAISKDYCSSPLWEYKEGNLGSNLCLDELNMKPEAVRLLNIYDGLWEQMYWDYLALDDVDLNDKWINELQSFVCEKVQIIHPEYEFFIL